jgi:hypothetical protein
MNHSDKARFGETQPSAARKATQPRDAGEAHRRWLQLTESEPSNPAAWIGLAESAADIQEKITSLNRALVVDPDNLRARRALHDCMVQLLRRDPRLEYLGETSSVYRLRTAEQFEFTHPKDRAQAELPTSGENVQRRLYGWLKWAALGLIPAGLGTLFFGPLATLGAVVSLRQPLAEGERRRIWMAAVLGAALWLLALIPLVILLLHLI